MFPPAWQFVAQSLTIDQIKAINTFIEKAVVFPVSSKVFESLTLCKPSKIKVVIVAAEPYRNSKSTGIPFEVADAKQTPSLRNIANEIQREFRLSKTYRPDLRSWSKQGVLMLNTSFGVSELTENARRDAKVWRPLIAELLNNISRRKKIVFMLWGNSAISLMPSIETDENLILTAGHPSPQNRSRQTWNGNDHFITANAFLRLQGRSVIQW